MSDPDSLSERVSLAQRMADLRFPDWTYIRFFDDLDVKLDGSFSAADLRVILAIMEAVS